MKCAQLFRIKINFTSNIIPVFNLEVRSVHVSPFSISNYMLTASCYDLREMVGRLKTLFHPAQFSSL